MNSGRRLDPRYTHGLNSLFPFIRRTYSSSGIGSFPTYPYLATKFEFPYAVVTERSRSHDEGQSMRLRRLIVMSY